MKIPEDEPLAASDDWSPDEKSLLLHPMAGVINEYETGFHTADKMLPFPVLHTEADVANVVTEISNIFLN